MTCKDPDLEQVTEVVGVEVKVMNKLAIEGGGEGENRGCRQGGPTKLPGKGGGQQQRPGKEEPLVGWRKEGASYHHQSWSQFLVGFIHPVRWHPLDDGRRSTEVSLPFSTSMEKGSSQQVELKDEGGAVGGGADRQFELS